MIRKYLMLAYAAGAYVVALVNIAYIVGFLADFGVPKSISDGDPAPVWIAVAIDAGLIGLFGVHHSITARTSFKRWWTKFIPAPIERATYLYMTAAMTVLLVVLWRPIPITIWEVLSVWLAGLIYAAYLATWVMMFSATFHFGHFGFFGLAQAWENFRTTPPRPSTMMARYLYAIIRHPISLGWMTTPLITPHLTGGHLVFAAATFAYIILATRFEEADLIEDLGESYRTYRERVPAFVPFLKKRGQSGATTPAE
ncbi:isoprenylcysteine carboxylmethyltransferase family protein [Hoeflea sp. TYP-13]|uniref:isoprenylcysteine carboxylmethyltransferase family protein n=1 Tax=Hoeflea sp. TYP-13 TaxID=3230023 RepID=UPI0034C5F31E